MTINMNEEEYKAILEVLDFNIGQFELFNKNENEKAIQDKINEIKILRKKISKSYNELKRQ